MRASATSVVLSHNSESVRNHWIREYHKIEAKLFQLKRKWNQFEKEAHREFQQWYYTSFSLYLSAHTERANENRELRVKISAIYAQMNVNGLSRRKAYQKVCDLLNQSQDPFPTSDEILENQRKKSEELQKEFFFLYSRLPKEEFDVELFQECVKLKHKEFEPAFARAEDDHELDYLDQTFRSQTFSEYLKRRYPNEKKYREKNSPFSSLRNLYDLFEESRSNEEPASDEDSDEGETQSDFLQEESQSTAQTQTPPRDLDSAEINLKTIYRKIVRLLHPDRGLEMTDDEKDLWGQTQEAYRYGDLERLKVIFLRVEGNGNISLSQINSIGQILELVQNLKHQHARIEYERSRVKKEIVYRFWASRSRPGNREKLKIKIASDLNVQLHRLSYETNQLKKVLKQFSKK